MLKGYFLRGVEDDYIFVVKTYDPEDICRLIARLCKARDKDLQKLGEQLEKDWNDRQRQSTEDTSKSRPSNTKQVPKRK